MCHAKAIVFNLGALGDLLISLPCIRFIRFIGYKITLVAPFPQALLLKELMEVDEVINASGPFLSEIYTNKEIEILRDYSKVFIFSRSHNPLLLKIFKNKDIDFEFIHTYPSTEISNYMYQFAQLLEKLSIRYKNLKKYDFCFKPFDIVLNDKLEPSSYIISVHLGSGSEVKNLPLSKLDNYIKIIDNLYRPKWFFITGPAESDEKREFVRQISSKVENRAKHLDSLPLFLLLKYIRSSSLFVGNDSGISHLAAFCGLNSILCFGPTNPCIWSPPFKWVKSILSKKECAPCVDYHKCKKKDCMKDVSLEDLISATKDFLG